MPAGAAAPARAWGRPEPVGSAVAGAGAMSPTEPAADQPQASSGSNDASTDLRRAKADEFVGWVAIAGSALALVGFLLPWSSSVIGATGVGYLDRWGFAGPGHLLIAVGLAAILVAAVLRERVPLWLGVGIPGLALGSLLIGLVWPYVLGPLGAELGVATVLLGSVLLAIAGISAVVVDRMIRHAGDGPVV